MTKQHWLTRFNYSITAKKVWRDLWQDPTRSLVVIVTITLSLFLLSTIYITWLIIPTSLAKSYTAVNPAHVLLFTSQPFDDRVVSQIRNLPEVAEAEGRYFELTSIAQGNGDEQFIHLYGINDFADMRLDRMVSDFGAWPPPKGTLLLERSSSEWLFDSVQPEAILNTIMTIQLADDRQEQFTVSGQGYDFIRFPSTIYSRGYVYISQETLHSLHGGSDFNLLLFQAAGDAPTPDDIEQTAVIVQEKLNEQGIYLLGKELREPNVHPLGGLAQSFLLILAALGMLGLVLGSILILNIITTLQANQLKQVGIMKTIGASSANLVVISLTVILGLGVIAVLISIPLSYLGGWWLTSFGASMLNLELGGGRLPPAALLTQIGAGLLYPLLIALFPIIRGSRVTVREAISDNQTSTFGVSKMDNLLKQLGSLPIFMRYGLRNIFRHKVRTALVVLVLSIAGAIFMTTISLRASLFSSRSGIIDYWQQDVQIVLAEPSRTVRVERVIEQFPQIVAHEGRLTADSFLSNAAGRENRRIVTLFGIPTDSPFLTPTLLAGRWLQPEDEQAIVLNVNALQDSRGIVLGEWVTLEVNGRSSQWQVVGISSTQVIGNSDFMASVGYVSYQRLARELGEQQRISRMVLDTNLQTPVALDALNRQLETSLEQAGIPVSRVHTYDYFKNSLTNLFAVPASLTLVMSLLFSIVGGLGLMGMMGLDVRQRTREIGVMRTIGSDDRLVSAVIITEGIMIGLLSWVMGLLLSLPISKLLGNAIGQLFLNSDLAFKFPALGIGLSLLFMLLVTLIACYVPVRTANQLIVRDALTYE